MSVLTIEQIRARRDATSRGRASSSTRHVAGRRPGVRPVNLAGAPACVTSSADSPMPIRIKNAGNVAEIRIYEQIGEDWYGDGASAASVVEFLQANRNKAVEVFINSPGGLVYDSLVIFNALASHPKTVTVTIEGLAYSAASFIALAGDTLKMFRASDFGIHCALTVAIGNKREMRSTANWLDAIDEHLVDIYQAKSGQTRQQITEWMEGLSDGTLFSATQAFEAGFCDEIIDPKSGRGSAGNRRTAKQAASKSVQDARNRLRRLDARLA